MIDDSMKKLAVIILNWNGRHLLERFLPGVVADTQGPDSDAEVVVADNGSTDDSLPWLAEHFPDVRVIALDKNYGFAEGYNRAIEHVEHPYVCLLNDDVETTPGWWQPLLAFLETNPDVGAVQPKIRSLRQRDCFEYAGAAGGYIDNLGYPFCRGRLFDSIEKDEGQYDGPAAEVAWASGACLMTPRKVYTDLGGLDPKFFAHMEEIDLCVRARMRGMRVCALSDSIVYHLGGASLAQGNPQKTYLNFRNNLLLLHKNLPKSRSRGLLIRRRLADTLAFGMFLIKGDLKNAKAVLRAHRDFRRMRRNYPAPECADIFPHLPGTGRSAIWARHVKRQKRLMIDDFTNSKFKIE